MARNWSSRTIEYGTFAMEPAAVVRSLEDAAAGIAIRTNPAKVVDARSGANARCLRVFTKQDYWSRPCFQRQAPHSPHGTKPSFRLIGRLCEPCRRRRTSTVMR